MQPLPLRLVLLRAAQLALLLWQAAHWLLQLVVGLLLSALTETWPGRPALPRWVAASPALLQLAPLLMRQSLLVCAQAALLPQQAARGTDLAVAPKQAMLYPEQLASLPLHTQLLCSSSPPLQGALLCSVPEEPPAMQPLRSSALSRSAQLALMPPQQGFPLPATPELPLHSESGALLWLVQPAPMPPLPVVPAHPALPSELPQLVPLHWGLPHQGLRPGALQQQTPQAPPLLQALLLATQFAVTLASLPGHCQGSFGGCHGGCAPGGGCGPGAGRRHRWERCPNWDCRCQVPRVAAGPQARRRARCCARWASPPATPPPRPWRSCHARRAGCCLTLRRYCWQGAAPAGEQAVAAAPCRCRAPVSRPSPAASAALLPRRQCPRAALPGAARGVAAAGSCPCPCRRRGHDRRACRPPSCRRACLGCPTGWQADCCGHARAPGRPSAHSQVAGRTC